MVRTTLAASLALGVAVGSASAQSCYSNGMYWGDEVGARQHIYNACNGYNGQKGALQDVCHTVIFD